MDHQDRSGGSAGPAILAVPWECPEHLVLTAAEFAAAMDLHLVCAFVDPASYLVEWAGSPELPGASLDPAVNDEAAYPSRELLGRLQEILARAEDVSWSFRVLNGAVAPALMRLADSLGASMFIVGGRRPGILSRFERVLEGSVAEALEHSQRRPVLVVPAVGH
ncbi:universal stress protein [Arthrobacter nitrophenolicus]|uniref:Nucleotide-binding universal stress UspA family protein n=1 Tax=Arthrobacter nitrophenolicus TaxID=683150 RepID=A0ACC6TDU2_9MICC